MTKMRLRTMTPHTLLFICLLVLCHSCQGSSSLEQGRIEVLDHQPSDSYQARPRQDETGRNRFRISTSKVSHHENGGEFVSQEQEAVKVLDLSMVHSTNILTIDSDSNVDVISASSSNCSLDEIEVDVPHLIDESVGKNCKNLRVIKMKGGGWNCSWPGWDWLKKWHDEEGHENLQPDAECLALPDTCKNSRKDYSTGILYQMECMKYIDLCKPCDCKFQYMEEVSEFLATVDCSAKNLSNGDIPKELPRNADFFSFEGNKLSDVDNLLAQTSNMSHLRVINLSNNLLNEMPVLQGHHAPNLNIFSLANNNISKLRGSAFDLYLNRSSDLLLYIKGNPLECDCQFYEISTDLKAQGTGRSVLNLFPDFIDINCTGGSLPKLYPHKLCPNSPLRAPLFPHLLSDLGIAALAALNLGFMVLVIDLQIAIYQLKRGYSRPRIPRIHVIYMFVSRLPKRVCHKRPSKTPPPQQGQAVAVEEDLDTRPWRHSS